MFRVLAATVNIFFSLVLGALAMGAVWYWNAELMQSLFQSASGLKGWLVSRGLAATYNNFLWFLIEERQLVFMGFVMVTRMVLAVFLSVVMKLMGRE